MDPQPLATDGYLRMYCIMPRRPASPKLSGHDNNTSTKNKNEQQKRKRKRKRQEPRAFNLSGHDIIDENTSAIKTAVLFRLLLSLPEHERLDTPLRKRDHEQLVHLWGLCRVCEASCPVPVDYRNTLGWSDSIITLLLFITIIARNIRTEIM